jgi:hypothetical protein
VAGFLPFRRHGGQYFFHSPGSDRPTGFLDSLSVPLLTSFSVMHLESIEQHFTHRLPPIFDSIACLYDTGPPNPDTPHRTEICGILPNPVICDVADSPLFP